ncbi:hypothetical protein [Borborobacter arsenicus]|uniref:hypothetical protein n=1 Tax=Borborobacter arsenicus TaxID=1851146 RepID=UPI0014053F36|nr:hypothetical protein [Pseudaminobacter arsenicus]
MTEPSAQSGNGGRSFAPQETNRWLTCIAIRRAEMIDASQFECAGLPVFTLKKIN